MWIICTAVHVCGVCIVHIRLWESMCLYTGWAKKVSLIIIANQLSEFLAHMLCRKLATGGYTPCPEKKKPIVDAVS